MIGQALILMIMLLGLGFIATNNLQVGSLSAENNVKNLGSTIDIAMLSEDIVIVNPCPSGKKFFIDGSRIEGSTGGLFKGNAVYYYLTSKNTQLPNEVFIDCSENSKIKITKSKIEGVNTLTIEGEQ